jgi:nucleoside-diphosphate-sugar epimerase
VTSLIPTKSGQVCLFPHPNPKNHLKRPISKLTLSADGIAPLPLTPYPNYFAAYISSKIKAYKAALSFHSTHPPNFGLTYIFPSFIIGKAELTTSTTSLTTLGSNSLLLNFVLGQQGPFPLEGQAVDVDDAASVRVKALKAPESVRCGEVQIFLVTSPIIRDAAAEIVKTKFSETVKAGVLPLGGKQETTAIEFDTTNTRGVFGWEPKSWEEIVEEAVGWYLEVLGKEKAGKA